MNIMKINNENYLSFYYEIQVFPLNKLLTQQQSFLGVSGGLAMLPSDLMCKELQLGLGDRSRVLAVVLIPLGD